MIGLRGLGGPCSSDPWARSFGDLAVFLAVVAIVLFLLFSGYLTG